MTRSAKIEAASLMVAVVTMLLIGWELQGAVGVAHTAMALLIGTRVALWTNGQRPATRGEE